LRKENIVNKRTYHKIIRSVPLRLLVIIAVIVLGSSEYTLAAPQVSQSQVREYTPYFLYRFIAGSSLHSADYTMQQVYQPGACISVLGTGNQFLNISLQLPDGARIDYLRLYYYDTDATYNGAASIRKYDGYGVTSMLANVSSTGTAGYGTTLSAYVGHVVDNASGGYVLNWLPGVTGSGMRLCGLRIAYRLPTVPTYLPLVFR
jgi:hypothetical protein